MAILIINNSKIKVPIKILEKRYSQIVRSLKANKVKRAALLKKDLTLLLVDQTEIKKLNKLFRGKNKPTDVLSFSPSSKDLFGEIAICMPIAKKQSATNKHSIINEITYLLLHGILHCLGYDHEDPSIPKKQIEQMFKIQDKVFLQFQK